jgi:hypothetical protein
MGILTVDDNPDARRYPGGEEKVKGIDTDAHK